MLDNDEKQEGEQPTRGKFDKFANIVKDTKMREKDKRKTEKKFTKKETMSKTNKNAQDHSYQSGIRSKDDPNIFKFGEEESEGEEEEKNDKKPEKNIDKFQEYLKVVEKEKKQPNVKQIEINKNIVEELRKKKEEEEKERQRIQKEKEEAEERERQRILKEKRDAEERERLRIHKEKEEAEERVRLQKEKEEAEERERLRLLKEKAEEEDRLRRQKEKEIADEMEKLKQIKQQEELEERNKLKKHLEDIEEKDRLKRLKEKQDMSKLFKQKEKEENDEIIRNFKLKEEEDEKLRLLLTDKDEQHWINEKSIKSGKSDKNERRDSNLLQNNVNNLNVDNEVDVLDSASRLFPKPDSGKSKIKDTKITSTIQKPHSSKSQHSKDIQEQRRESKLSLFNKEKERTRDFHKLDRDDSNDYLANKDNLIILERKPTRKVTRLESTKLHMNRLTEQEKKPRINSAITKKDTIRKDLDMSNDHLELIRDLKQQKKNEHMTDLIEESFARHFSRKRDLDEEHERMSLILDKYENENKIGNSRLDKSDSSSLHLMTEEKTKLQDRTEDYSRYTSSYEDEEIQPMHMEQYDRFYKSDFYKNQIFREQEEENQMAISNKDSMLFKSRLIYNYFHEKTNVSLPKFTKFSEKDRKCQEIMKLGDKKIEDKVKRFYDRCFCLELRRFYYKVSSYISMVCHFIVNNPVFDNISLLIILTNTMLILISDPLDTNSIANTSDSYFLYIYTGEMFLKIFAYGFVVPDGAYIKDMWNILDFFVIVFGWISFIMERALEGGKISGLAGLRAFRILRPLKTVKSIKGLRSLIVTLLESLFALSDIAIVLFFFFLIFSIAGVQMWQGLCLRRCMSLNFGYFYSFDDYNSMCSTDADCVQFNTPGNKFICAKSYINPNNEVTHFDNAVAGLITVFVIASMEGWTEIWNFISLTFKDAYGINAVIIFAYFHILLFVGGYYLINLFLAVIKSKFTMITQANKEKEANQKRSFYELIKEKYDQKKLEMQAENENKKTVDLKEEDALKKLKSQFVFINKNEEVVPINYNTINDILCLNTMTPEEMYDLKHKISDESKNIKNEFENKVNNIKKLTRAKTIMPKSTLDTDPGKDEKRNSILVKDRKRGTTLFQTDIIVAIIKKYIQPSIEETVKWFENDLVNSKRQHQKAIQMQQEQMRNNMKNKLIKLRKREEEKKKEKNEISIKEDLSFEVELKKLNHKQHGELPVLTRNQSSHQATPNNMGTNITKSRGVKVSTTSGTNSPNGKRHRGSTKKQQQHVKIEDELSFFSDNTEDDIEEDYKMDQSMTHRGSELIDNFGGIANSLAGGNNNQNSLSLHRLPSTLLANKKSVIDPKNNIVNAVSFKRPTTLMSVINHHKDKIVWKKKIEEKRKHFNVDEYISHLKPIQMNKLGRRRSFLKMLQFVEEKANYDDFLKLTDDIKANGEQNDENLNKSLEISLYHDENLLMNNESLSDFDMIPARIPTDDKYIEDDLDFDEMNKKHENNKFMRLARNSMFDNRKRNTIALSAEHGDLFFKKINLKLNNNIVIDMKEPRRGVRRALTRKSTVLPRRNENESSKMTELSRSMRKDLKPQSGIIDATSYKATSVEKNYFKYPQVNNREVKIADYDHKNNFEVAIKEKKERVPDHLTDKRKYLNYLHNIFEKDFTVQDVFKADYWREDVLGPKEKDIEQLDKPSEKDPIFVFNDSSLNLKTYGYQRYRNFEKYDEDFIYHNHQLKYIGAKAIEIFPPKSKFYGMLKSEKKKVSMDISARSLSRTSFSRFTSRYKTSSSTLGSNLHRSKTVIGRSSCNTVGHGLIQDLYKAKKGNWDKLHRKLNHFNFKTLSHYFLDDERLIKKVTQKEEKKDLLGQLISGRDEGLEVRQQIEKIRVYDIETNSRKYIQWSGQQVLNLPDDPEKYDDWNEMLEKLEQLNVVLWKEGWLARFFQKIRFGLYSLSISMSYDLFIISIVILNALVMSLDGNLLDPDTLAQIQVINFAFNSIFISEFVIKFIGLGPVVYFSDLFTYLDLFIIAFAIMDMATDSDSTNAASNISSQLSFLRVFRIFRVLRLTKVLRKIKAMRKIIKGITNSLSNVSYIIMILMIFILIFQLLGMSLLNSSPRYQTFLESFYVTFQVLSVENWNEILYELMVLNRLSVLYLIVWIFLGNYILFNLFVSVLLDSFDDHGSHEDEDQEEKNEYEKKVQKMLPKIFEKYELEESMYQSQLRQRRRGSRKRKDKNSNSLSGSSSLRSVSGVGSSKSNISGSSSQEMNSTWGDDSDDMESAHESTKTRMMTRKRI